MRKPRSFTPVLAASMLLAAVLVAPVRAAPMEHDHIVNVLTYSADGKTILSGSWDQTVRLWDAATGKEIRIPADEVELIVQQRQSIMPELLLRDMTAEQVADLLEYLSSLK